MPTTGTVMAGQQRLNWSMRDLDLLFATHLAKVKRRLVVLERTRLRQRTADAVVPHVIVRGSVGPSAGDRDPAEGFTTRVNMLVW